MVVVGRWRPRLLAVAAAVVVVVACSSDSPVPEDSQPSPMYEVTCDALCSQSAVDAIGTQLSLADVVRRTGDPVDDGNKWITWCVMSGLWKDERFATRLGEDGPTGGVSLEVYADAESALRRYEVTRDRRQELVPQSPVTRVDGWWDEGWRIQWYDPVDDASTERGGVDAEVILVYGGIRHHNLVILVDTRGTVPGPMRDEGYEVLSDLGDLLIEEARRHVTLSTSA